MNRAVTMTAAFAVLTAVAWAEGTVTTNAHTLAQPVRVEYTWTASTNGFASWTTVHTVCGKIARVLLVPGTGATRPTNDTYTVTLKDAEGVDLLAGLGTGASNAVTQLAPALTTISATYSNTTPFSVNDQVTGLVTNCGKSCGGSVVLYLEGGSLK